MEVGRSVLPPEPAKHVRVKSQRKSLSSTMAMYFQSSITSNTTNYIWQICVIRVCSDDISFIGREMLLSFPPHLVILIIIPDVLGNEPNSYHRVLNLRRRMSTVVHFVIQFLPKTFPCSKNVVKPGNTQQSSPCWPIQGCGQQKTGPDWPATPCLLMILIGRVQAILHRDISSYHIQTLESHTDHVYTDSHSHTVRQTHGHTDTLKHSHKNGGDRQTDIQIDI